MSGFTINTTRDDISPMLKAAKGKLRNATPLMRAIGTGIVGLAKESFNDASKRQTPWPAKVDGSPATLKSREASLWRSLKVQEVSATSVKFGSDRPYAAIHQFGGTITPKTGKFLVFNIGGRKVFAKKVTMPARPYLPVTKDGQLTPLASARVKDIIETHLKLQTKS